MHFTTKCYTVSRGVPYATKVFLHLRTQLQGHINARRGNVLLGPLSLNKPFICLIMHFMHNHMQTHERQPQWA